MPLERPGEAAKDGGDSTLARRVLAFLAELGALPYQDDPSVACVRVVRLLAPAIVDGASVELIEDGTVRTVAAEGPVAPKLHTVCVALSAGGDTFGHLTSWLSEDRPFAPADVGLVEAAAQRLSSMLERRRLAAVADEALALRDRFLGMASHELRTPLQAIGLAVQLVLTRLHGAADEVPREWLVSRLERTQQEIVRMRLLVDALLDATALRSGRVELLGEPLDLRDVVQQVVERLREQLEWSRTPCTVTADGPAVGVWDRQRLEIVITNLLTNAMKYGAEKPIHLEIASDERRTVVSVSDRGQGIAPEDQARLFRPFERLAQRTHIGGFGLGLWTVKQLVQAMGGTVSVESQPNAGAKFTVTLPR